VHDKQQLPLYVMPGTLPDIVGTDVGAAELIQNLQAPAVRWPLSFRTRTVHFRHFLSYAKALQLAPSGAVVEIAFEHGTRTQDIGPQTSEIDYSHSVFHTTSFKSRCHQLNCDY